MRAVVQRVKSGRVTVGDKLVSEIGRGMVILLGIGHDDNEESVRYLADKISNLRIFEDTAGKMNLSLLEVGGEAIVVSQFTLYADTSKGRRPSFINAATPESASVLVNAFVEKLSAYGVPTQKGEFGEHMIVEIVNDGPVTIILER